MLMAGPFLVGQIVYLADRGLLPKLCFYAADAVVRSLIALTPFHHDYAAYVDRSAAAI